MRTGWTEEYLLARPHCHNKRKFNTYRLLDRLEESRPLIVIPAVGENLGMLNIDGVMRNYEEQYDSFKELLGVEPDASSEAAEASEEFMEQWFERRFGRKPVPIEDLING
jgi:hypothetical protein